MVQGEEKGVRLGMGTGAPVCERWVYTYNQGLLGGSGLKSNKEFYADPDGGHRFTVCCKTFNRMQDLKTHRTRLFKHIESTDDINVL